MAAHGEFGVMPDAAVFADTQWEPEAVYEHLTWLMSDNVLPFPVYTTSAGDIRQGIIDRKNVAGNRLASVPWFTEKGGMGRRQCTKEYKIRPLEKKMRELLGYKPRQRIPPGSCEVWIGISLDEAIRMKPAFNKWQVNRWPLVERGLHRRHCLEWLKDHGYPEPPKSACIGCPYHTNAMWRDMRDNDPGSWEDAVEIDAVLRDGGPARKMTELEYMHRDLVPLDQVDLRTAEDKGQLNMFLNECEGMCGV
jgi:hypothetical protein